MKCHSILLVFAIIGSLSVVEADAVDITWKLPVGSYLNSAGGSLGSSHVFEVGAFSNGFVPTFDNRASWKANWVMADRAQFQPEGGPADSGSASSRFTFSSNTAPFQPNGTVYLWGFSIDQPTNDWILLTEPGWVWPSVTGPILALKWELSAASQAVIGETVDPLGTSLAKMRNVGPLTGPVTTAKQWRSIYFLATGLLNILSISGWTADPDGDGLTNLVEMSLGTHPLVLNDDVSKVPQGEPLTVNNVTYASVSFDKDPKLFLNYVVETSNDLKTWSASDTWVIEDSVSKVIARDAVPLSGDQQRFIRINVRIP